MGERAGLIGANNRGATKRFHRRQRAHNGVEFHQPLHTNSQHNGRNNLQAFGNGCHGKAHGHHKHFQPIVSVEDAYRKYKGANSERYKTENLAQLLQTFPHWGFGLRCILKHMGNFSHFGVHTGSHNHAFAAAVGDHAGGETHIGAVAQGNVGSIQHIVMFFHRHRFAREGRFLNFKVYGLNKPHIGRNNVAGVQHHNIAGNHIGGNDFGYLAIAHHFGVGRTHFVERIQRRLRLQLLHHSNDGVNDENGKNHIRFYQTFPFHHANNTRNTGGNQQNNDHAAFELLQENSDGRFLFFRCELVMSVLLKPFLNLLI